jgi:hypothetical protein
VELDALEFGATVADAHDDAVVGFGGDGEFARQRFAVDDEGVVARGGERVGEFAEDAFCVVMDGAGFTVEEFWRANDFPAECGADSLMAETHTQNWKFSSEALDEFDGDAGFFGCAGAGGDDDAFGFAADDVVHGDFIVAVDFDVAAEFAEILGEVVGEGVVVVEEEDHCDSVASPIFARFDARRFRGRLGGRGIC